MTMKQARKQYRVVWRGKDEAPSFKAWARKGLKGTSIASAKLRRIVGR